MWNRYVAKILNIQLWSHASDKTIIWYFKKFMCSENGNCFIVISTWQYLKGTFQSYLSNLVLGRILHHMLFFQKGNMTVKCVIGVSEILKIYVFREGQIY